MYEPTAGSPFAASSASQIVQTATTTSLNVSGNELTATVSTTISGGGTPTGSIVFSEETSAGASTLATMTFATGDDSASYTLSSPLPAGAIVAATYVPTGGYESSSANFAVPGAIATTTTLYLDSDEFEAYVTDAYSGSVTFYDGTTELGNEPVSYGYAYLDTSDVLSSSLPTTGVITATFSGSGYDPGSATATLVSAAATTTSLTFAPTYVQAYVSGAPSTGTVTFSDGNTVLDTEPVSDGYAYLYALPPAGDDITAAYSGGGGYLASSASLAVPAQVRKSNCRRCPQRTERTS